MCDQKRDGQNNQSKKYQSGKLINNTYFLDLGIQIAKNSQSRLHHSAWYSCIFFHLIYTHLTLYRLYFFLNFDQMTKNNPKMLVKAYFQLQYVFFYGVKIIFLFDLLKIVSDQSYISQNLRLESKWSKQILFTP